MSRTRTALGALAALTVLLSLIGATPDTASAAAPPYVRPIVGVSTYVSPPGKVWDLAFAPDGTLLFTLKPGEIKARVNGVNITMAKPSDVVVSREGGMMGLAVDPDFTTNRRIYTCLLSRADGHPDDVRVVRWKVAADYSSLSERTDIVTGIGVNPIPGEFGRHSGCRPEFGPDGNLWIGTGDAAVPTNPQNPQSLAGKVLRVDTNGVGVAGNAGGAFRPEIYSYGHRNVQGIAFRPSDGKPYSVEQGTSSDDEVNALVAGANYGWDPVNTGDLDLYDESTPMTDLTKFPDAHTPVWTSGDDTIATSGGTFLSGSQWQAWDNSLAIGVLKGQRILVLTFDAAGTSVTKRTDRVWTSGRLRSTVQGPDGNLYVNVDANPGAILKLTPNPTCTTTDPGPFADVDGSNAFCREITWAKQEYIANGYDNGTFRPFQAVTRQAFAGLLAAFNQGGGATGSGPTFLDVGLTHPFYNDIEWLAQAGIATGYGDFRFHPSDVVTRQAFAAFLYRWAGSPPVDQNTATFADVPVGHPFHDAIEWMVGKGYTTGFADSLFHAADPVSRQAAAAFFYRAEDLRPPGNVT